MEANVTVSDNGSTTVGPTRVTNTRQNYITGSHNSRNAIYYPHAQCYTCFFQRRRERAGGGRIGENISSTNNLGQTYTSPRDDSTVTLFKDKRVFHIFTK